MASLSVIIIAKNEAPIARRCLESVKWADEIIVFDSGSTDGTQAICREYTDQVFETDWPGYGMQKQRALEEASCDWVLSIDMDEEVSPELKAEIQQVIAQTKYQAYKIPINLIFCGQLIKYANGRTNITRLFKREASSFTPTSAHETVIVEGKVGLLNQKIYHLSFKDISTLLVKLNRYSSLTATSRLMENKKASFSKALLHSVWMFIKVYFLRRGFLDGKPGFILAMGFAQGSYYRYLKMLYPDCSP